MRTLDQIMRSLPAGRRSKIAARTQQLIAEELSSLGEAPDTNAPARAAKAKKTRRAKHRHPQLVCDND